MTSLHDGMNLVAKEFVAAHNDEDGVLVVSKFTGAATELLDALIVNPYDIEGVGEAIHQAAGDKQGIERYGFYYVTMDESLARCCLDLSGRASFAWNAPLSSARIGDLDIELISHFFRSVAENAKMNLHLDLLRGTNSHHCVEALFKAFARALGMAVSPSRRVSGVPSTKGKL